MAVGHGHANGNKTKKDLGVIVYSIISNTSKISQFFNGKLVQQVYSQQCSSLCSLPRVIFAVFSFFQSHTRVAKILAHPVRSGPRLETAWINQFSCLLSVAGLASSALKHQVSSRDLTYLFWKRDTVTIFSMILEMSKTYIDHWKLNNNDFVL